METEIISLIVTNFPNLLVALAVSWALATGRIIPRSVVDELIKETVKNLVLELKGDLMDLIREEVAKAHNNDRV